MEKPKYYYHVSNVDFGDEKTLYPRAEGKNRGCFEPKTSRICVGPSPWHCLVALGSCLIGWGAIRLPKQIHIYRTKGKVSSLPPKKVVDSSVTKERWLTKRTAFVKVGSVPINDSMKYGLFNFSTGHFNNVETQTKQLPILRNWCRKLGIIKTKLEKV